MSYDGLDRLTSSLLPEGGGKAYTYDGAVNPWANNVASLSVIPKPGSLPLSPLVTTFVYNGQFNKPTSITDPRGGLTSLSYDSATGNVAAVTTDVGASPTHVNAQTTFTYNALGLPVSMTNGTTTVFVTDADNREVLVCVGTLALIGPRASRPAHAPRNRAELQDQSSEETAEPFPELLIGSAP